LSVREPQRAKHQALLVVRDGMELALTRRAESPAARVGRVFVLAAAGEGATLADQWKPHRQCSVAVSGGRVDWCPEQALRRSGLDFQGIGVYRSDVGAFGQRGARCAGPRHDERPAWPQVMPRQ
jgi:hypothetical protein